MSDLNAKQAASRLGVKKQNLVPCLNCRGIYADKNGLYDSEKIEKVAAELATKRPPLIT